MPIFSCLRALTSWCAVCRCYWWTTCWLDVMFLPPHTPPRWDVIHRLALIAGLSMPLHINSHCPLTNTNSVLSDEICSSIVRNLLGTKMHTCLNQLSDLFVFFSFSFFTLYSFRFLCAVQSSILKMFLHLQFGLRTHMQIQWRSSLNYTAIYTTFIPVLSLSCRWA